MEIEKVLDEKIIPWLKLMLNHLQKEDKVCYVYIYTRDPENTNKLNPMWQITSKLIWTAHMDYDDVMSLEYLKRSLND